MMCCQSLFLNHFQKRRQDADNKTLIENRANIRVLRSFQQWGVMKTTSGAALASASLTPASPATNSIVNYDTAAATFFAANLIDKNHPLAANFMKSPSKAAVTRQTSEPVLQSPGKTRAAREVLKSPEKKPLQSPRTTTAVAAVAAADVAAENTSPSKVQCPHHQLIFNPPHPSLFLNEYICRESELD